MENDFQKYGIIEDNFNYLKENHKEIYEAYETYGNLVHEKGGPLDDKSRWLIKIALSTSSQYQYALRTHMQKALRAGCSQEEIEHVLLLAAPTCGFPTMMQGILVLRDVIKKMEEVNEK